MEIAKLVNGKYGYEEIKRRYWSVPVAFCRLLHSNTPIAIIGTDKVPKSVWVVERHKVPVWKQSLQVQCCKRPTPYSEDRRQWMVGALKQDIERMHYELYEYKGR